MECTTSFQLRVQIYIIYMYLHIFVYMYLYFYIYIMPSLFVFTCLFYIKCFSIIKRLIIRFFDDLPRKN